MDDTDSACVHCGASATLLCDFILGFEWMSSQFKKGTLDSPEQGWHRMTNVDGQMFTCDRPLCEGCATYKGAIFYDGPDVNEIVTCDYCREHAESGGREGMNVITEAEAEVLRGRLPGGLAVVGSFVSRPILAPPPSASKSFAPPRPGP